MKKLYLFILIPFFGSVASAQTLQWVNAFGGVGNDYVNTMSVDNAGNNYVAGKFQNTVDFDPGSGQTQRTASASDAFIAKYNASGVFQWVITFGNTGEDIVYSVKATSNAVYVTGFFTISANFNPLGTDATRSAISSSTDIFVAKYTTDGILQWVNTIGSTDIDSGNSLSVNAAGDVFVAGAYYDVADFDPSVNDGSLYSWGGYDMFLAKYSSTGTYQWAITLGSVGLDEATSVLAVGENVWLGGYYNGLLYPDNYDGDQTIGYLGATDGYYGKYNGADGTFIWGGTVRSASGFESVNSIASDGSYLYIGGGFGAAATLTGALSTSSSLAWKGNEDAFVARIDINDSRVLWANVIGGTGSEALYSLAAESGQVLIAGSFTSNGMDVDPSPTTWNISAQNNTRDGYLLKYNYAGGAYVFSYTVGSAFLADEASVITTGAGSVYYGGVFQGAVTDLDPVGTGGNKSSNGGYDGFFGKLNPVEPVLSPTALSFAPVGSVTFNVSFASSIYYDGYLTLLKQGSAPTFTPGDGNTYTQNQTMPDGSKVLFVGPENSIPVINATPGTQYFVTVFPYNGSLSTINYKTTSVLSGNVTTVTPSTEPTASPTAFAATNILATTATINFTAGVGASGYIGIRAIGEAPDTNPTDGIAYAVGNTIGNSVVAFIGTATSYPQSGLSMGTDYRYKVYAYSGSTATLNYRTSDPLQGSVFTAGASEPNPGPSDLQFSKLKTTGFTYTFTKSTDVNVTGYLAVFKEDSPITFVPTDGVAPVDGQTNPDGSTSNIFPPTTNSVTFTGSPNTKYYFRIFAYSGSGTNTNYQQTDFAKGSQSTLDPAGDTTEPDIVDNTQSTTPPNTDIKITVVVTDDSGIDEVTVKYSSINSTSEQEMRLQPTTNGSDTYEGTIAGSFVKEQGVEYTITAVDNVGIDAVTDYTSVIVEYSDDGLTIPYSAGKSKENYRIISIPLDLDKKAVNDVFSDDLGDYKKSKYRLFRYSGTSNSELSGSSTMDLGKGYWFIASDQVTVDSGPGTTANAGVGKPITVPITQGWNQIGNPFNFDVVWNDVVNSFDNEDKTLGGFYSFEGGFNEATSLKKMSGGFVMVTNAGDGKLKVPAYPGGRRSAPTPVTFARSLDSDTWAVDLQLKSGGMQNVFAGFGMHPGAKDQNDKFDNYTLPRFFDYLELNFNKKIFGSSFTKDIVPTSPEHTWEFQVESNLADEIIDLHWDNSFFGNSNLQLVLWDVEQQRAVDMKKENHYTFERSSSGSFRIFFGSDAFVKAETIPTRVVFHSVSPVPSATNITFAFSVPGSTQEVPTSLAVYNTLGQKVATLLDKPLGAGYQQAVWTIEDGTKPAAGVYISVLKFGETTLQKRLIIK